MGRGAILVALVTLCAGGSAQASTSTLLGPAPTLPSGATALGPVAASQPLNLVFALRPRDPAGLQSFVAQVSTPGSPLWHQYLTESAFVDRFAPTARSVTAVEAALRASGLNPTAVAANRLSITVATNAAAGERALGVSLERYRLPGGQIGYANRSAPHIDASVAASIEGVLGLQDLVRAHPLRSSQPATFGCGLICGSGGGRGGGGGGGTPSNGPPAPCPAASAKSGANGPYTSNQLASAYHLTGLYGLGDLGTGATIGLFEEAPYAASDVAAYQSCFGTATTVTNINVDGGPSGALNAEPTLDIEELIGFAPGVSIRVYQAPNNVSSTYDTYSAMVNDPSLKAISTSWGLCEPVLIAGAPGFLAAESSLFQQAAAVGKSVFAASGDQGSEDCAALGMPALLAVDDPASQPYVTGVGGTSLRAMTGTESVWNIANEGASGGGLSAQWTMPSYQSTSVSAYAPLRNPCGAPAGQYCREVPDVSADADPATGEVFYFGGWTVFGGTSISAPLWAAASALADQSQSCSAKGSLGFVNPSLYGLAASAQSPYPGALTDITVGNNDFTGAQGGLYPATAGFDLASGLGTPVIGNGSDGGLVARLCGASQPPPPPPSAPTVTSVSPSSGPAAGGTVVTVTGTGFTSATSVTFGSAQASFTVVNATTIRVTAPAGSGTVDVVVTTPQGPSGVSAADRYTYTTSGGGGGGGGGGCGLFCRR